MHAYKGNLLPTILVSDDEPALRDVLQDGLRDDGYEVVTVAADPA